MRKVWPVFAIAVVIGFLSWGTAIAQDQPKHKGKMDLDAMFKKIDTNGDGFISQDEWLATARNQKDPDKAKESYKKMDTAGDGKVTPDEFKAYMKTVMGHHHKKSGGDSGGSSNN